MFGYDGVHPTAFGYAYIANQFIDSINAEFGGRIPHVDLYPFVFGPLPQAPGRGGGRQRGRGRPTAGSPTIVFTAEARRSLLQSLGVPQAIIDGTYRQPRPPRHH